MLFYNILLFKSTKSNIYYKKYFAEKAYQYAVEKGLVLSNKRLFEKFLTLKSTLFSFYA